jgi:hypothetical protein
VVEDEIRKTEEECRADSPMIRFWVVRKDSLMKCS